jgi:hypothetical protein
MIIYARLKHRVDESTRSGVTPNFDSGAFLPLLCGKAKRLIP